MIHTKEVKVRIVPKNYNTYKALGYDVEINKDIIVNIKDLAPNSRKLVKVECDNCHSIKELKFCDYITVFNKKNKYYCSKCKSESIKDGVHKKYGSDIDNVFQLKSVKDKTKITCKKLYGFDHHLQNKDILQKLINTNQKLYGVNFIPELKKHTQEIFLSMCEKVHGDLYDYSKVAYTRMVDKVIIICKKHGDFEQLSDSHLKGMGCPKCKISKGENFIMEYLNDNNIPYMCQKKFDDCKYKTALPFDFYFHDKNMCLEYDGIQHFMSIEGWGGEEEFKLRKKKDIIKNKFCKNNNIRLERIKYDENSLERLDSIFKIFPIL